MTQARWNWFAVSDIISAKCVAGFAMDLPLHGINKHTGSAAQPECEGATDVLYAFSADAQPVTSRSLVRVKMWPAKPSTV